MNPNTQQTTMQVYASADTPYKTPPNEDQMANGVVPLDTLPAAWWNWLWNALTSNNNYSKLSIADLRAEMTSILTSAGITPSELQTNQILNAIEIIRKRFPSFDSVTHDPIPGAVISSSDANSVSVSETTGKMTVNALSDWNSQDTVKSVLNGQYSNNDWGISAPSLGSAATVNTINSQPPSVAGGSDGKPGLVQKAHSLVAAEDNNVPTVGQVRAAISAGQVSSVAASLNPTTKVLTITVNGVSGTVDLSSLSSSHALSATYLRPSESSSVAVTADGSGNLTAHSLTLS